MNATGRNDCMKLVSGVGNRTYAMEIGTAALQLLRVHRQRLAPPKGRVRRCRDSSDIEKLITKKFTNRKRRTRSQTPA